MSPYSPPSILFNRHIETIYPSVARKVTLQNPERERITTPDDDFLDLDWFRSGSNRCVIISHGLEGNSSRAYVTGMAKAFLSNGYDVLAWNFRGCSGEINKQLRFYHSGATDDLGTVVNHVSKFYNEVFLIGFSLGGNVTLKYLGESKVNSAVKRSATFSVPIDLHKSCLEISKPHNWIYSERFLRNLKAKVRAKAAVRKDLDTSMLNKVQNLKEFDDHFTGPLHGFTDAIDYYTQCSSIHFLKNIQVPTLMVNSLNDPFLSEECFPKENFQNLKCEFPDRGGHVGFALFNQNGLYWSELRALSFIDKSI
ncbi:MAG: alpha/beta fold hydrolase [Cyclobacteriaceae bacterium]|nr:alpha/beta fold hydrolase [Cyclobacteriaceae bacterium]